MAENLNLEQITDFIREVETSNDIDVSRLDTLIQQISDLIREDKENGKVYGTYRGQLLRIKKEIDRADKELVHIQNRDDESDKVSHWVPIQNGYLKIGHKPGEKNRSYTQLLKEGATTVFTILGEQEGALDVQKKCESIGIDWIWLPLPNGNIPAETMIPEIAEKLKTIKTKLGNKEKIYVHCSAGLHRTGMITNCILRFLGFDEKNSYEILQQLRPITAREVGIKRLDFGRQFDPTGV